MIAADGLQNAAANAEMRTLKIHHSHTKEDITITYKRNGRFDDAALGKLNHFLRDWRNHEQTKMDPRLFDVLWEVYEEVGGQQPIVIISAYRSPQTNSMLRRRSRGVAKHSRHMLGQAIDFNIPGAPLEQIRAAGLRQQRGGVGFYPSSGSPFVHLDVGSVRHWPRMAPEAYARVMRERPSRFAANRSRPANTVLASADADTARSAARTQPSWWSRFTGGGAEEAQETFAPRERPRRIPPERAQAVAAAVAPMPPVRPADGRRTIFTASATAPAATIAAAPLPPATPAEVVQARGLWQATDMIAAAETEPTQSNDRRRYVWRVGAQPVATRDATVVSKRAPAPRARPEMVVASAVPITTASVPWPTGGRDDRVPSEIALAYAAEPAAPRAGAVAAAPMGVFKPPAASTARPRQAARTAAPTPAARAIAPSGKLTENPWMRGIMLASSVQGALGVTVFGPPSYRALTPLMHKPASAIANTFADDPGFGMTSGGFAGAAVSFVPMVTFGTITAGLN